MRSRPKLRTAQAAIVLRRGALERRTDPATPRRARRPAARAGEPVSIRGIVVVIPAAPRPLAGPGGERSPGSRSPTKLRTHPLDVDRHLLGGRLQAADLAAETGVEAERSAQVDLEPLDLVAVVVGDDLALEPDVGDLDAGAGVGAAVDVDRQGHVDLVDDVREPFLEQADGAGRGGLGVDDGELAVLQAGARHGVAAEHRRLRPPARARAGRARASRCGPARRRGPAASGAGSAARASSRAPRRCRPAGSAARRRRGPRRARRRRSSGRPSARGRRCGRRGRRWAAGAGPSGSGCLRYSVSSTSRNFSGPQSASRNFSRALWRIRR